MNKIESLEIETNGQTFSVEVDPEYGRLSDAWEKANQAVMETKVIGNTIPQDKKIAAAESVIEYDRQLKEVEVRLLLAWHNVAKTDVKVSTAGKFFRFNSVQELVSNRISELALIESARPGINDDEANELFSLTEFMAFPSSIIQGRVNRESRCSSAREHLPLSLE